MSLSQLLRPDAVLAALRVNGKKQALQEVSERAALVSGLPAREIFDAILQRERLGSTGVGDGVAIPHGKLAKCQHIFGVFARLERPIDFEAPDGLPVDLIFMLIAPEAAGADHLKALAMSARLLRNGAIAAPIARDQGSRGALRASDHGADLERGLIGREPSPMKARVIVTLKSGVLDPQGKAIEGALKGLAVDGVRSVRQGKIFDIELDGDDHATARSRLSEACERLLANTIVENYAIEIGEAKSVEGTCARR